MANNIRVLIQKPVDGSGSGVQSVNGDGVNNTDPLNPVLAFPNADEVDDSTTTNKFATGTNTGDQKTVESFPTQETTAFTVADNSDRAWINCDFAAETEVTIMANSVGVVGEPVYFSLSGDGQIKFVESGVTISFNADQSLIIGSKGDKIGLLKTGVSTYEIV